MSQLPGPAEFAEHEGDHTHRDVSGGALRAATFGAMDGLVTNIALVAGVGGGGADRHVIILTGMAGLVAGAFSMALGEFASVQTQNDAVAGEVAVERAELARHPKAEEAELVDMYREMGLSQQTAEAVAREVHADPELALKVHVTQELGVDPDEQPSPWLAAISSFLCFAVGGIVPLLPLPAGRLVARRQPARRCRRAVPRRRGDVAVHRQAVVVQRRPAAAVRRDRRRGDVPGGLADRSVGGLSERLTVCRASASAASRGRAATAPAPAP